MVAADLPVRPIDAAGPKVLFLRSFGDDVHELEPANPLVRTGGFAPPETFEVAVLRGLKRIGRPMAIGRPREELPPLGAQRIYVADAQWQGVVERLVKESRLVALMIGSTNGLRWEIRRVFELGVPEKILLVFPPLDPGELLQRWALLLESIRGIDHLRLPAEPPAQILFGMFREDWTFFTIQSNNTGRPSLRDYNIWTRRLARAIKRGKSWIPDRATAHPGDRPTSGKINEPRPSAPISTRDGPMGVSRRDTRKPAGDIVINMLVKISLILIISLSLTIFLYLISLIAREDATQPDAFTNYAILKDTSDPSLKEILENRKKIYDKLMEGYQRDIKKDSDAKSREILGDPRYTQSEAESRLSEELSKIEKEYENKAFFESLLDNPPRDPDAPAGGPGCSPTGAAQPQEVLGQDDDPPSLCDPGR
jgi:hypothetical protein